MGMPNRAPGSFFDEGTSMRRGHAALVRSDGVSRPSDPLALTAATVPGKQNALFPLADHRKDSR